MNGRGLDRQRLSLTLDPSPAGRGKRPASAQSRSVSPRDLRFRFSHLPTGTPSNGGWTGTRLSFRRRAKTDPTLSQALHLLNGDTVQQKVQQGGVVARLLKEGKTPSQVIENLYLRCLCRKPTDEEMTKLTGFLKDDKQKEQTFSDLFWSLLNSKEFVFNH